MRPVAGLLRVALVGRHKRCKAHYLSLRFAQRRFLLQQRVLVGLECSVLCVALLQLVLEVLDTDLLFGVRCQLWAVVVGHVTIISVGAEVRHG